MPENALLTTAAAPISPEQAAAFASTHFGKSGDLRPLTGERDQNFQLRTPDGAEFVLKFTHPAEDPAIAAFQCRALQHIAARDPCVGVPRVVAALNGATHAIFAHAGEPPRIVRLFSFLKGPMLHQIPATSRLRRSLGETHARVGLALRGFSDPAENHDLVWDLKHAARLGALLGHITDPFRRALAQQALDGFTQHVAPRLAKLRTQVIHNDLNAHNVVVDAADHERVAGILDFGDMVRSPLICDVAVAGSYLVTQGEEPLGGMLDFLGAYHAVAPLVGEELDVLFDLIVTRLAMTVLITGWRAALFPANATYILRNNPSAWAGLERLKGLDRAAARAIVQTACEGAPQ